jgi:hypothetical protein
MRQQFRKNLRRHFSGAPNGLNLTTVLDDAEFLNQFSRRLQPKTLASLLAELFELRAGKV